MNQKKKSLTVQEAAEIMGCTPTNVWLQIRRRSLKAVRKKSDNDNRLYTCLEWIEEYQANLHSKDLHSNFNGRKVFDTSKGELSLAMVAKELGVGRMSVEYYIKSGQLQTFRKGAYHVVLREELERFKLAFKSNRLMRGKSKIRNININNDNQLDMFLDVKNA